MATAFDGCASQREIRYDRHSGMYLMLEGDEPIALAYSYSEADDAFKELDAIAEIWDGLVAWEADEVEAQREAAELAALVAEAEYQAERRLP